VPFDLLADKDFRREVTSSFCSTSREAWQQAHASRTDPPDFGKYKPKFDTVWKFKKEAVIRNEVENEGAKRVHQRQWQQNTVCDKVIRSINPVIAKK